MSDSSTISNRKASSNTKNTSTTKDHLGSPSKQAEAKQSNQRNLKFGPLPSTRSHRTWTRAVLFVGLFVVMYFYKSDPKDRPLAKQNEFFHRRGQEVVCSEQYSAAVKDFSSCAPANCGRYVTDSLITLTEVELLMILAKRGLALGGSSGCASVIDFHSGILSYKDQFINFYKTKTGSAMVTEQDFVLLKNVEQKLKHAVAETFRVDAESLYLTYPTLFSELKSNEPVTAHDEYWHPHIDMVTYDSFYYTTLLYLTDYGHDFKGGRFVFISDNSGGGNGANYTVEPRKGRTLMFTSGPENRHYVERVAEGARYALTVAFTCDPNKRAVTADTQQYNSNSDE